MTKFQRKLYMLSFVISFLLTAPALIFIANGYSFDWVGKVFVHNGSVTIKSIPTKIDIYIDGEKVKNKRLNFVNNTYVINGVRFGQHTIECRKKGYATWKKTVDIHSGISTEFWNVLLTPTNNQTLATYNILGIKKFFLSPRNKREIVLYKKQKNRKSISLLNTKNQKETTVITTEDYDYFFPSDDENIEWSSNHKKLLIPIQDNNHKNYLITYVDSNLPDQQNKIINLYFVLTKTNLLNQSPVEKPNPKKDYDKTTKANKDVNSDNKLPTNQKENASLSKQNIIKEKSNIPLTKDFIHQVRWMFDSDYQLLVLTTQHQLLFVDIENPLKSRLIDNDVNGFDLAGDHVYYVKSSDDLIWDIKPNKPTYKQSMANLPLNSTIKTSFAKVYAYDELRIAIINDRNDLYIVNKLKPKDNTLIFNKISKNVQGVQFSNDGKKMLYWTDKSIWVYMLRKWDNQPHRTKDENIFITMFLSGIENVQWMETFENIIFTNNNLIKTAEIDNRDKINIFTAFTTQQQIFNHQGLYNKNTGIFYFLSFTEKDKNLLHSVEIVKHNIFFSLR